MSPHTGETEASEASRKWIPATFLFMHVVRYVVYVYMSIAWSPVLEEQHNQRQRLCASAHMCVHFNCALLSFHFQYFWVFISNISEFSLLLSITLLNFLATLLASLFMFHTDFFSFAYLSELKKLSF